MKKSGHSIWWFAFGYFACYAPYSALTKAISDGMIPGLSLRVFGFELLPVTAVASLVGMLLSITVMDWWKYAGRRRIFGRSVPWPGRWTFLSGLCTAAIIPTTTLAYTFGGVSIVFMMLLMRGGVLAIAPMVDLISNRRVRWYSWVALCLAISALFVGFSGRSCVISAIALVDVAIYLAAYFVRLRFMSRLAKSDDLHARTRYFVEEQMIATPAFVLMLVIMAGLGFAGVDGNPAAVLRGFALFADAKITVVAIVIGLFSQGTGMFGGLILLDRRENTFCVPVNRASSVLAGVLATMVLWLVAGARAPSLSEMSGAMLIIAAIAVLSTGSLKLCRKKC